MLPLAVVGVSTGLFGLIKKWTTDRPNRREYRELVYIQSTFGTKLFKALSHLKPLLGPTVLVFALAVLVSILYEWFNEARASIKAGHIMKFRHFDVAVAVFDKEQRHIILGVHQRNPFKVHVFRWQLPRRAA
jgi:hypothetical protein